MRFSQPNCNQPFHWVLAVHGVQRTLVWAIFTRPGGFMPKPTQVRRIKKSATL